MTYGFDGIDAIIDGIERRRPLDRPHVITVDGWSGSGKSSIAAAIAERTGGALVHLDDFVPGWSALDAGVKLVSRSIVEPIAAGRPARARSYDWTRRTSSAVVEIAPSDTLVLEGCGAGAIPAFRLASARLWIDAPRPIREQRLRSRSNWPGYAPHRAAWARQELRLALRRGSRARAHLIVRSLPGRTLAIDLPRSENP